MQSARHARGFLVVLFNTTSAEDKRASLRDALHSGKLLRFPGAFSPLVAMLIEDLGFDGAYISGAVLSNDLGLPDIGLTTLSEVARRGHEIARVTKLPSIIDLDTGFGEPMNVARSVQMIEGAGIAGCHIEDQVNPKRCGHLDNKQLTDIETMARKVRAAIEAKRDPNFLLIARTDARNVEGLEAAINRVKAYVDAGAEMIFPEALADEREFEQFRKAINVPLLANMTEFGKSPLLSVQQLHSLGYNLVIYPVTTLRLAVKAVEDGLKTIRDQGTQQTLIDRMQTRAELYKLLRYEQYNSFDASIFNFRIE
jgi:methylisocitrate lyase